MPIEPRWLDRKAAALYLSVRPDQLPGLLKAGKIPQPSLRFGPRTPRWDRLKLDEAMGGSPNGGPRRPTVDESIARLAANPPVTRQGKARLKS